MKKVLLAVVALVVVVVGGGALFLFAMKPSVRPAEAAVIEATPELVERGRYLTHHVSLCMECHSDKHADRYSFPPIAGTEGTGSDTCWDGHMGMPEGFNLCPPNLTADEETGLGAWSDGEIMRAIREGVDNEGQALFAVMPYTEYKHMSDYDARAIVAYLKTLPKKKRAVKARSLPMPFPLIVRLMPEPLAGPVPEPDRRNEVAHGEYLATIGGCKLCHTPVDEKHVPLPGMDFSGGQQFMEGEVSYVSANLTPHETGLGDRSREEFIALFRSFGSEAMDEVKVARAQNTVMPWRALNGMTDEDLGAIYAYLRTVKPIENQVVKPPKPEVPEPPAPEAEAAGGAGAEAAGGAGAEAQATGDAPDDSEE